MRVLSFGEILLRLASPGYTRLFQKENLEATFCGGEANVAVSLANYGVNSEFLTVVPNNAVGKSALNSLRYFGVDCSKTIYKEGRMGLYYLEKGASQRSSKVIYDRKYSSIALATLPDFEWDLLLDNVDWFHWTGINPALSESLALIIERACQVARKRGIVVSCDLNYRQNLWSAEEAQAVMTNLMKYVDICIANEEDAEKVLGIAVPDNHIEAGMLNVAGYEYVAKEICEKYGCKKVAITLRESYSASKNGWRGVLYDAESSEIYYSKRYEIDVVDRVGGGDSFTGALIYSIIAGMDNQECIDFAAAASCLKHSIEGDFNRVTVEEVKNLIKTGGGGRVQR